MRILVIYSLLLISQIAFGQNVFKMGEDNDTIYYDPSNPPQVYKGGVVMVSEKYNNAAKLLFSRMDGLTIPFKEAVSQWYDTIQAYNIDDSLDCRYYFAANNSTNALLDWFNSSRTATLVNTPTFTANEGILTNGTSSYIRINYVPADINRMKLTSNSISVNLLSNGYGAPPKFILGISDATSNAYMTISTSETVLGCYNNTKTMMSVNHNNDVSGSILMSRLGNSVRVSRNGKTYSSQTIIPAGESSHSYGIYLGASNANGIASNFLSNKFSSVNIGSALSQTQATVLHKADSILFLKCVSYDVYILIGQSNALGAGVIGETTAPYNAKTYKGYIAQHNHIEPIDPPNYNTYYPAFTYDWFGLENSLVHTLNTTNKRILVIKYAVGGAYLTPSVASNTWNPSVANQYYSKAVNHIDSIVHYMNSNKIKYSIKGFIWFQGEADGTNEAYATAYQANESTLIRSLRAKYGNLPFYSCQISENYSAGISADVVNASKLANSTAITDYHFIETSDLTWKADNLHLNTVGVINLGIRIANEIEP